MVVMVLMVLIIRFSSICCNCIVFFSIWILVGGRDSERCILC